MLVSKLEKSLGMEFYETSSEGIGGIIRQSPEDFVVEEILADGSRAKVASDSSIQENVLGASSRRDRYLLCILVKRNWDTFKALGIIAQQMGISPIQVQIAGIKDAKAVTAQFITIENAAIEDAQNFRLKDMELRPIGFIRNRISPFYLRGNNFIITIRKIKHRKSTISKRILGTIEEINRMNGIPNFFGHQRFGTIRPITHLVGKALIMGHIEKAAKLFLSKPSRLEHSSSKRARQALLQTGDFKQALKDFPKQLRYERLMLRSLSENQTDFSGAFRRLPIRLRRIFIQAYQSYLFNKFLSSRIKHGLTMSQPELGDYAVNIERSGIPMPAMHKTVNSKNQTEIARQVQSGKMRLALPLIGVKQPPSQGCQGELEQTILENEGISPQDFAVVAMPDMISKGELRAMMTPIHDFDLVDVSEDPSRPSTHAAKITFTLQRGSYATVVLRELIKTRTPVESGF